MQSPLDCATQRSSQAYAPASNAHNQGASWPKLLKNKGGEIYLPLASSVGATRQLQRALVQTSHDKIRENTTYQSPEHFPIDGLIHGLTLLRPFRSQRTYLSKFSEDC